MKPAPALLLYLLLTFGSAAALSPLAFVGLHGFLPAPFHRYVDRALMVSALVWMGFFWGTLGLKSWADLHLTWRKLPWGILLGFLLGLSIVTVVAVQMIALDVRQWLGFGSYLFIPGMVAGFLVLAFIEELLFRGVAQTIFIRQWGRMGGILATTLLFAIMHFVKVPADFPSEAVHWYSGWMAIGGSLSILWQGGWWGGYLVVLLLLGGVLSLSVLYFRSLAPAIGIHAGLIIGQRLVEECSRPEGTSGWLVQPLNAHLFTQVLLAIILIAFIIKYRRRDHGAR